MMCSHGWNDELKCSKCGPAASARLSVAGEDLFKALVDLVKATEDSDNIGDYGVSTDSDEMIAARAAIKKALG